MAQACRLSSTIRRLDVCTQPSAKYTNFPASTLSSRGPGGLAWTCSKSLLKGALIAASSNRAKRFLSERRLVGAEARVICEDLGLELRLRKADIGREIQSSEETSVTLKTLPDARAPQVPHRSCSLDEDSFQSSLSNDSASVVSAPVSSNEVGWGIFEPLRRIVQYTEEKFSPRVRGLFLLNVLTFLYGKRLLITSLFSFSAYVACSI